MPTGTPRLVALVVGAALLLAACGDGGGGVSSASPEDPPTTTTTVPPGGRQPTPEDPLLVTLAGDSVMAELAPALIEALEATGETDGRFILTPSLARSGTELVVWNQELQVTDPDLIVLLVGLWEDQQVGEGAYTRPGWAQQYRAEVVDPFLDLVTGQGAKVLWIGMPSVRDEAATTRFAALNSVFAAAAEAREDVGYLTGDDYLAGPDGGYTDFGTEPATGATVRLRRIDGHHLCPDGVVALATAVLEEVDEQWNVGVGYGWQQGTWRQPRQFHAPEECPAPV